MDTPFHFAKGSEQPQIPDDGQLRLYSMRFCPFAHRVHLTLNAKNVPYHVVYINLSEKPEWYAKVNPNGKVPALQLLNEPEQPFLTESLLVCEYLDEKYPGVTLFPKDPLQKAQAKLLIERFSPIGGAFYRLMYDPELKEVEKSLDEFHRGLDVFEEELQKRNTTYFGGEQLNIIDYGIWPWFERFGSLAAVHGDKYKLNGQNYPKLTHWMNTLAQDAAVQKHYLSTETHTKFSLERRAGVPNYNMLLDNE